MTKKVLVLAAAVVSLALSGCMETARPKSQGIQIEPTLSVRTAESVKASGEKIRLPQNYDPANYKMLRVAASFFPENRNSPGNFGIQQVSTVASRLETELSKLKRFTILSRSSLGQQAIAEEKRFQDMGTVRKDEMMRLGKQRGADYIFTAGVLLSGERFDRVKEQEVVYTVLVNYQLISAASGEIIEADTAEGRARRTYFQLPSGRIAGGFNPNDSKQLDVAINEASMNALRVVANKLGNKLPVGGKVTGIRGTRFQVKAGHQDGLMGEQLVVIYTKDSGVDVPLALGKAEPGKVETTGTVISWTDDPDSKSLVQALRTNPVAFLEDRDVYAVSYGMPLPPEWEKNYRD